MRISGGQVNIPKQSALTLYGRAQTSLGELIENRGRVTGVRVTKTGNRRADITQHGEESLQLES